MNKYMDEQRISSKTFISILKLFQRNNWPIDLEDDSIDSRFNRFCERISLLDTNQQNLIIELSSRFKKVDGEEYLKLFLDLLKDNKELLSSSLVSSNKIFVFPLISPKDFGKTKSSKFLHYFLKNDRVKYNPFFHNKRMVFCDMEQIDRANNLKNGEKILLVDDYIGTGETAKEAIEWFDKKGHTIESLVIIVLAAQKEGLEFLRSLGAEVYSNLELNKGISDYYEDTVLEDAKKNMRLIEKKIGVETDFLFGYKKSEALISLNRTPNNTFPVFWLENSKYNIAPFPR